MELNANFNERIHIIDRDNEWRASPSAGVDRKMLDRIGAEVARATTIVRYAPKSKFPEHTHNGGEEFIVLNGVFEDEHGHYPAGSYIRNPPTSSHSPSSNDGTTIFVKLWQFSPDDRRHVNLQMDKVDRITDTARGGVTYAPLFKDERETVRKEYWTAGAEATIPTDGGAELIILAGTLIENDETLAKHDWLRVPDGYKGWLKAGPDGVSFWLKFGHLRDIKAPS